MQIIKKMWVQEQTTFEGKYHRVKDAYCEPRPDPVPVVMIGAFEPKMLRLTAQHADWWNVSSTSIADYRKYVDNLDRACDEVGRDPKTIRRSWCGGCACAPTDRELAAIMSERLDPGEDFIGTPQQVIEQMQPFVDLGVDTFMLDGIDFPELMTISTLMDEVLPAFSR